MKIRQEDDLNIELTGNEVEIAIDAWLVAQSIYVDGPRTITVNGKLIGRGEVHIASEGFVIHEGIKHSGGITYKV